MTRYEWVYCGLESLTEVHFRKVRRLLKQMIGDRAHFTLLDIGGRKSQYTIGVKCTVQIVDLPLETELQRQLGLGLTPEMIHGLYRHRSNITDIRLEDFTQTTFPDNLFDGAVSVEVIEHVPDDDGFLRQLHRVLRPGAGAILTTPNGETVENVNPDHHRHYTRQQLINKLEEHFGEVDVFYGVRQGYLHEASRPLWTSPNLRDLVTAPWRMACLFLNNILEPDRSYVPKSFDLLFAVVRKAT